MTAINTTCLIFSLFAVVSCVIIHTPSGDVQGIEKNGYRVFKGIPYAEPPIRWKRPVPKQPWANIFNATSFGHECPQSNNEFTDKSEDCLFLNVWTPINSTNIPVMVYIHGGAWTGGQSHHPVYYGDFFANGTLPVILVSMNYRLGAFGFIVSPPLIENNLGILDQRLALSWVNSHIKSFGGDPSRVTIFGQSAGGASVAVHLTTFAANGPTFSQAIVQSDPIGFTFRTIEQSLPYTALLASNLGCARVSQREMVDCMMEKNMTEVLQAQDKTIWIPWPLSVRKDMPWQPVIDGTLITDSPWELLKKGRVRPGVQSVILGSVQNESVTFVHKGLKDPMGWLLYESFMYTLFGVADGSAALHLYPVATDCRVPLAELVTDIIWNCPMKSSLRGLVKNANITSYLYHFLYSPILDPLNNFPYCKNGVSCHSAEVPYVFHSAAFAGSDFYTRAENELSYTMMDYWKKFAHGIGMKGWEHYNIDLDPAIMFTIDGAFMMGQYRAKYCDFLEGKLSIDMLDNAFKKINR